MSDEEAVMSDESLEFQWFVVSGPLSVVFC